MREYWIVVTAGTVEGKNYPAKKHYGDKEKYSGTGLP
jgi:hypothetical protein